jgi:hypothetical protein
MRIGPIVLVAALGLHCREPGPQAPREELTSAPIRPAAPPAQLALPDRVMTFAVLSENPERADLAQLLRALADALDDMPQSHERFAVAATGVRANADLIAAPGPDVSLLFVDALRTALQAIGAVAPRAAWRDVDPAWLSIDVIQPRELPDAQMHAIHRALQSVARALVACAIALLPRR